MESDVLYVQLLLLIMSKSINQLHIYKVIKIIERIPTIQLETYNYKVETM